MVKPIKYKPKPKKCKQCGNQFNPYTPLQIVCSPNCALEWNQEKEVKKRVKTMKKELLTHSDYLGLLQVVFNKYIRLRDKDKGCITCSRPFRDKFDAGHFLSVGAYPNLRFNEDNVHGQCVHCNQHLHSNNAEYFVRLPERIGLDRFNKLLEQRNEPLKLTIPEIKTLIEKYKKLCKNN